MAHSLGGVDLVNYPERGYSPRIRPALAWNDTTHGGIVGTDYGYQYDTHEASIDVFVPTATCSAIESLLLPVAGAVEMTYIADNGIKPFGPHIDCSGGVQVWAALDAPDFGGRIAPRADLWRWGITMRLKSSPAPGSSGSLSAVLSRKPPQPHLSPARRSFRADGPFALPVQLTGQKSECTIHADNLTESDAIAAVDFLRTTRTASFSYSPPAGIFPFGVAAGSGTFDVFCTEWSCKKVRPRFWEIDLTLRKVIA